MLTEDEKQWAVAMKNKLEIVREEEKAKREKAKRRNKNAEVEEEEPEFLPPGHGAKNRGACACVTQIRIKFYEVIMMPEFDTLMMTVILLNMVSLAGNFYNQPDSYTDVLQLANQAFTYVFITEMACKLIGLGYIQYLSDVWNRLDGGIVCFSVLGMIVGLGPAASLLRSLRVLRLLRMVKTMPGLRSLATTLYLSIPSLGNVGIMLVLIIYIWAILGMNLFYQVKHQTHINAEVNFETFWPAIITLTRVITFDGWRGLMTDLMVAEPDCGLIPDGSGDTNCGSWVAVPFFFVYIVLGNFLMLNIFTAVILRNFADAAMDEGLAGEGFMSESMFKMQQLDAYLAEFQRRYRVFRRRKEEPVWLYSSWDHSFNPSYCPECGTIPCMAQQFDPILEVMCSPHMKLVHGARPDSSAAAQRAHREIESREKAAEEGLLGGLGSIGEGQEYDPRGVEAVASELFDEADLNSDGMLDSEEFKLAYARWEAEQQRIDWRDAEGN